MPNTFAYVALLIFPIISAILYLRYTTLTATFWTIVGGYLFLPVKVGFDVPLLPVLDQENIPALCAIFGCVFIKKKNIQFVPKLLAEKVLVVLIVLLPVATALTNLTPMFDGRDIKPGLQFRDAISTAVQAYFILIPFLLGMSLVRNRDDMLHFLTLMAYAGLIYSPLVLLEVRLSPQLHDWVYGFFPHSFRQQVRLDGFRPVVFIGHGLLVAIFYVAVFICTAELHRQKKKIMGMPAWMILGYFAVVLLLCKSVGAWLIGSVGLLVILTLGSGGIPKVAGCLAWAVFCYPLLCLADLFPHQALVDSLAIFGEERGLSLGFRFFNENLLLEHTREKLLFGWGGYGRNRPADIVTDGFWVIQVSQFGMCGFITLFALMLSPTFRGKGTLRRLREEPQRRIVAFAMFFPVLLTVNQIPNSSMYSWLWFSMGSMAGLVTGIRSYRTRSALSEVDMANMPSHAGSKGVAT